MHAFSNEMKAGGKKIGLVPTMGYLHQGHLSLVKKAKELTDVVVVSIFVNPAQFAPNEDLAKYPRNIERDKSLLINEGVDAVFIPDASEIYAEEFQTNVEVRNITQSLEGAARPTHFRGVTTVVAILFNAVKPDYAVFGQKDAQQAAVIIRMVKDLKYDIQIIVEPIIREKDGLAMSSRNVYLSPSERADALVLFRSLQFAESMIKEGKHQSSQIISAMKEIINSVNSSDPDYISIVSAETFVEQEYIQEGKNYYILIACRIGKTRLIDNLYIEIPGNS